MNDTYLIERRLIPIAQGKFPGKVGRHVNHDSRSKSYRPKASDTLVSKSWKRLTNILNQGNIGACVGNSSCGLLGTTPLFEPLISQLKAGTLKLDEAEALSLYSLATRLDSYAGEYPPSDTGSDGLSGAKACQQQGLISGYTHAFTFDEFLSGMQLGPAITGTNWYTGMDTPDRRGLVVPSGEVRGGHEYEVNEIDLENQLVWFINSWGRWGLNGTGRFGMTFANYQQLLSEQGDITFFIPLDQEPPEPTPVPVPTPTPTPTQDLTYTFTNAQNTTMVAWANSPHGYHKATIAAETWKEVTS